MTTPDPARRSEPCTRGRRSAADRVHGRQHREHGDARRERHAGARAHRRFGLDDQHGERDRGRRRSAGAARRRYRALTGNQTIYSAFTAAELQAGSSGSTRMVTPALLAANLLNLAAAKPASATANGRAGQYWVDATGLYVCIAANTWRYFAGATF